MLTNLIKLLIAVWIVKHFALDNDLVSQILAKVKEIIKEMIK